MYQNPANKENKKAYIFIKLVFHNSVLFVASSILIKMLNYNHTGLRSSVTSKFINIPEGLTLDHQIKYLLVKG